VDQGRRSFVNIIFLILIFLFVKSLFFTDGPTVPASSALLIKPVGIIVEEFDYVDPLDEVVDELSEKSNKEPQTLLRDVIKSISLARQDQNITALVLDLSSLQGAAPSKLQNIANAIETFKSSGKPVYAYSEFYNQYQYFLAAQADEVYMDPLGSVYIEGYGRFNTYYKDALNKLGVKLHIFKVGTYKSAVEPFIRNDMSDAAKEANRQYLGDLWNSYIADVATARNISAKEVEQYSNNLLNNLSQKNVTPSTLAKDASLIDGLKNRHEFKEYIIDLVGSNSSKDTYKSISYKSYLDIVDKPKLSLSNAGDKVAVVIAKGIIYNGTEKPGAIGGESTAKLISKARRDDNVKALVLRVDSPGGSAYASEVIRREILRTKAAGKPVVVSMGSYAASGGYWISASADEIWASPTTITGSIGIFGLIPTLEEPMNKLGIHRDGVGTTKLSGAYDVGKPLRKDVAKAIQTSIDNGYDRFLSIVAEGRNMSKEDVDTIAQGRVWSGKTAHEIGLVDQLGGIELAIDSAANRAGIVNYETYYVEHELSESERFIKEIFDSSVLTAFRSDEDQSEHSLDNKYLLNSPITQMIQEVQSSLDHLLGMNDPQNTYAHCLCEVR
ncbi:MAG: signal peptide peptidase SppA, partial [Gammaproteobacteria bacterium]|nr:signal peptide peptidase SppA [Gammaproteobacteria bacterium]